MVVERQPVPFEEVRRGRRGESFSLLLLAAVCTVVVVVVVVRGFLRALILSL